MAFALPAAATAVAAAAPAAASAVAVKATLMAVAKSVLMNVAISAAMSALQPQVGSAGRTFEWTLDPNAPIPFAAGRVGVAGTVAHLETYGPDKMYYGFVSVLSGSGPIRAVTGFMGDDETVTFDGNGKAVSSQWAGEMWFRSRLGAQPDTQIPNPAGLKNNAQLPNWTSGHRLSGKAGYMLVLGENSKRTAYPTGEPKPLVTVEGLFGWDPRQDDTYPGGLGPCRLNDPATWVWLDNPILWGLKWELGLWEGPNGKGAPGVDYQVGGTGTPIEGIDVGAFVSAANVADANGWKVAAYPTTDDDKAQVLDSFLQAGGAIYAQRAGKTSCIQRAAPRASILTITAEDTAGPLEIDTAASRIDRINTIRPRFWSEAHRWQMTAIDDVSADAYRTEDGAVRSRGIDYPFVPLATQAAQLAALQIAHTREGIAGTIPLKPHCRGIWPGLTFTISEPGFLLDGLKCLCLNREYDPMSGIVTVTFVSETDGKYAFALGQSPTPPAPQVLTPFDPTVSPPDPNDWNIIVRPPAPGGGGQMPGFEIRGVVNNATAHRVLVETGPTSGGPWTQAYLGPPTAERIDITVDANTTFFIAVSYFSAAGVQSARTVYGPYTTNPLIAGGLTDAGRDQLVEDLRGQLDGAAAAERLAETLLQTILDEQQAYEAEADRRMDADVGVFSEATSYTTGSIAEAMNLVYTKAETDDGMATTLQVAKSYTDTLKSESELLFSTKTERANGDAAAVLQAKAYTDDFKSEAGLTYATQAALGSSLSSTLSAAQSYTNGSVSTALSTVYTRAEVDGGLATTLSASRSYTDALRSDANTTFATTSALGGVSSTASLALSTAAAANGTANATFGLATDVNGYIAGFKSVNTGTFSTFYMLTDVFGLFAPSGGPRSEYINGVWYFYPADNLTRTMIGKPFGGSYGLVVWCGPNSVPVGSENKGNAYVYISTNTFGGGRFGGSDVGGGTAPLQATASAEVAYGFSAPGGGFAGSSTITITPTGSGAGGATCRWTKVDGDAAVGISASGFSASFFGTVPPGGMIRAFYLAVVYSAGQSVTLLIDVQLSDPT